MRLVFIETPMAIETFWDRVYDEFVALETGVMIPITWPTGDYTGPWGAVAEKIRAFSERLCIERPWSFRDRPCTGWGKDDVELIHHIACGENTIAITRPMLNLSYVEGL